MILQEIIVLNNDIYSVRQHARTCHANILMHVTMHRKTTEISKKTTETSWRVYNKIVKIIYCYPKI